MHNARNRTDQPYEPSRKIRAAAHRAIARCDELATCSDDSGRLTRTFCGAAMQHAHQRIMGWMHEQGMSTHVDSLGNLIGCLVAPRLDNTAAAQNAGVFMIGSHLDTVIDAGRFDGPLGVLLGIAVAEVLSESTVELPFALHVVGFSEEEGVRFGIPYLGSRAMAGIFDAQLLDASDADGCTMRRALTAFGCTPDSWLEAKYPSGQILGFVEPHIEQGPILQQQLRPVAVVSAIAGQTRATLEFTGRAGHAGTVPHPLRRDALAAAAEFIIRLEQLGQQTEGLRATVGVVHVEPNVSNVIAGRVQVRVDLRHERDDVRLAIFDRIQLLANECGDRRAVAVDVIQSEQQAAVAMDARLSDHLDAACRELGILGPRLVSGAGHDAAVMAHAVPTSMLFLRCRDGISHHPDESVHVADVEVALDILVRFFLRIAEEVRQQIAQPNQ